MKPGTRALGIAESHREDRSTVCGAVTTTTGRPDGFVFADCTVGGLDATDAIMDCWVQVDRPDVQYVFIAGVAWAWYNIVDPDRLGRAIDVPVALLSFEESDGLADALATAFEGEALDQRRRRYERLPPRRPVEVDEETVYVRFVGEQPEDPAAVIRSFTQQGGRPEPVRVARLAARAADRWRHEPEPL